MRWTSTAGRDLGQDHPDLLGGHATAHLQRQAFPSVFINQAEPLETPAVAGPIEEEVPGPDVVLAPRGAEMAGVRVLAVRPAWLDLGRLPGQLQPELTPVATHRPLVGRPALAVQHHPDPSVAEPRVDAREGLDPPCQGRPL